MLLDPKDAPAKPMVEQGEVALRVPEEALPQVEETATPYGLSPEQHAKLKELWYERGHYVPASPGTAPPPKGLACKQTSRLMCDD